MSRKASAIVGVKTLDQIRPHFERSLALLLIGVSIAGSIIALHGGWAALTARWSWAAAGAGAGLQIGCTGVEWLYRSRRRSIPYVVALLFDTGTSLAGFGPIFHARLMAWLVPSIGDLSWWGAWLIIGVLALLLAWIPEGRLIDD